MALLRKHKKVFASLFRVDGAKHTNIEWQAFKQALAVALHFGVNRDASRACYELTAPPGLLQVKLEFFEPRDGVLRPEDQQQIAIMLGSMFSVDAKYIKNIW